MSADVIVVGGGIIGCAAAAFLAEAGARVTLFEAGEIGAGASGRNSGAVQYPFDDALAALHDATLKIYRSLDGFGLPAAPAGLLLLTDDLAAAERRVEELTAVAPHLAPELVTADELQRAEPILAPGLCAVRLATAYPVAPEAAVHAFARRARNASATIELGRAVVAIDTDAGRARGVALADGSRHAADAVLVAAGPWTPELLDATGSWQPIRRTWGVTVQVRASVSAHHVLEEGVVHTVNRALEAAPEGEAAVESLFSMVSVDGLSTIGSTFLAQEPDVERVAPLLVERGARIVPALAGAEVVRQRRCARPQSIDGRPLIGRLSWLDGLVMCAGHGPWGISIGPATARMASDVVLGRDAVIEPALDPARFGGPNTSAPGI